MYQLIGLALIFTIVGVVGLLRAGHQKYVVWATQRVSGTYPDNSYDYDTEEVIPGAEFIPSSACLLMGFVLFAVALKS